MLKTSLGFEVINNNDLAPFCILDEEHDMFVFGETYDELLENLEDELWMIKEEYVEVDVNKLSNRAKEIRKWYIEFFNKYQDELGNEFV